MARRRRSNTSDDYRRQRDFITTIATHRVLRPPLLIHQLLNQQRQAYADPIQDRRRHHPKPITRPITATQKLSRLNHHNLRSLYESPFKVLIPDKALICVRRKARREVLHALRRTGKGAGSKRRYTFASEYHC